MAQLQQGLLEILKVCRILIMLMVGRQCNIQNKRASESQHNTTKLFLTVLGHFLVFQDLTSQLINKDNCQKRKDNKPLICIKTVARQLPRIICSAIPRSIVIIIIRTVIRPTNGGLSESVELGSFIVDLNQLCQADFEITFEHQDRPSRFQLGHGSFLTGENVETQQYQKLVTGILIAAVRDCQTASYFHIIISLNL